MRAGAVESPRRVGAVKIRGSRLRLGFESGANGYGCNTWRGLANAPPFIISAAITSTAATDNELAIDCSVLLSEPLEIAGVP